MRASEIYGTLINTKCPFCCLRLRAKYKKDKEGKDIIPREVETYNCKHCQKSWNPNELKIVFLINPNCFP